MTTDTDHPRVGAELANGCRVIAWRPHGDSHRWIVLATTDADTGDPYVTWVWEEGVTFWGHYFSDITEAALDFADRDRNGLAAVELRPFGPILALDGITVSLSKLHETGQPYVLIETHDAYERGLHHLASGEPTIQVDLNDSTLHDEEPR